MLQAQADFAEASSALADKTEAASALDIELEQLRRELGLKQEQADQAAASAVAAPHHQAALQQQLQQQHRRQARAELQKQQRSVAVVNGEEAQDQLGSPATTQPGQVSYFPSLPPTWFCAGTFPCLSVCACMLCQRRHLLLLPRLHLRILEILKEAVHS